MPRKLDVKFVEKFLFFPVKAINSDGQKVVRFFEKTKIEYTYDLDIGKNNKSIGKWIPTRFLD